LKHLLLATKNVKKVREMREILAGAGNVELHSAADFPAVAEPDETGETFAENARQKALYYAAQTGMLALADDSGLVVDALMGRPGVHSSRYGTSDDDRINKLLGEMRDVPDGARAARFRCAMALAAPGKVIAETEGTLEGMIARERRGEHGFGYDPVFFVSELGCHLAEADAHTKNGISHRGVALQRMMPLLLEALTG
jgi:XTP/dITP diphosphohydrolase